MKRIFAFALMFVIVLSAIPVYAAVQVKTLKVHFIDVGQGASQLIIGSSGKTILIDAGNNSEEKTIVNYLKKQKIKKIDILIGTHPDADHVGGMDAVVSNFAIGKIYMPKVVSTTKTYEDVLTAIKKKNLKVTTAKAGLTLDWEKDATIKMIAPVGTYDDSNEMSAVIKLTYGSTSFLFMGDAESKSENDIIKSKENIKSDVLLVGHHGSNSSTSQKFLNAVNPKHAVIQVGNNSYGHPTNEIIKRLTDKKTKIYRNDKQGTIIFTTDGKKITTSQAEWKSNVVTTKPTVSQTPKTTPKPSEKPQQDNVVYANCTAVREAGKAPIRKGDPGYSTKLDRDGDGVACE
ncbi:MBL fold metallo-hydrolase [Paenibacillus sp. sgz302251]|uniref:MBL fold metallo-hydrolase n=1 Tax=Paenibacillus sp. sgz302251 TaxID=3414493 RepID=UPI003C7B3291